MVVLLLLLLLLLLLRLLHLFAVAAVLGISSLACACVLPLPPSLQEQYQQFLAIARELEGGQMPPESCSQDFFISQQWLK